MIAVSKLDCSSFHRKAILLAVTTIRFLCNQINAEGHTTDKRTALRRPYLFLWYCLNACKNSAGTDNLSLVFVRKHLRGIISIDFVMQRSVTNSSFENREIFARNAICHKSNRPFRNFRKILRTAQLTLTALATVGNHGNPILAAQLHLPANLSYLRFTTTFQESCNTCLAGKRLLWII